MFQTKKEHISLKYLVSHSLSMTFSSKYILDFIISTTLCFFVFLIPSPDLLQKNIWSRKTIFVIRWFDSLSPVSPLCKMCVYCSLHILILQ